MLPIVSFLFISLSQPTYKNRELTTRIASSIHFSTISLWTNRKQKTLFLSLSLFNHETSLSPRESSLLCLCSVWEQVHAYTHLVLGFLLFVIVAVLLVTTFLFSGDDTMMLLSVACVMLFSLARVYSTWFLLLLLCWCVGLFRVCTFTLSLSVLWFLVLRVCSSLAKEKKH